MNVNWIKNQNGEYFDFLRLNLDAPYFMNKVGVYMIWYATPSEARVIYVGQGEIGERLKKHREDLQIMNYAKFGQIRVSWLELPGEYLDGVEAFLFDTYKPIIGERTPAAEPIPVNLP